MITWQQLVETLGMQPHPEGGYYKETYRAEGRIEGKRSYSTAIYYLLPPGASSKLHRMKSDEIFHFYLGGPMTLVKLGPKGEVETVVLGQDLAAGQAVQHLVRAGWWFGGYANDGSPFSLVGCTVAPGFEFEDFELGDNETLARQYPSARALIGRLALR
jgi:uncharacterized protein